MVMSVTTLAERIARVPASWEHQYKYYGTDLYGHLTKMKELLALPPGFSKQDVDTIIGNTSWTSHNCGECNKEVDTLLIIDTDPDEDHDKDRVAICMKCLRLGTKLLKQNGQ